MANEVWYGSLQNRFMERCVGPNPEVGMGATEYMWSDREAYEIISVKDERHCTARRLDSRLKEGSDWLDQDYEYFSNEKNATVQLFKKKNGRWVERYPNGSYGNSFGIGHAEHYRDPSF